MSDYTISRKIHFQTSRRTKKTIQSGEIAKREKARTPRISKLMALAIHFQQMLHDGHVEDMATLARYGQVTRARVTQIMNLLLLAPDIQETILNLPKTTSGRDELSMRKLQPIALEPNWAAQRCIFNKLDLVQLP